MNSDSTRGVAGTLLWRCRDRLRLHLAIAHYFNANGGGRHGSLSPDSSGRSAALRSAILSLHQLFGEPSGCLNHLERRVDPVTDGGGPLQLTICVSGDAHLLDDLQDLRQRGAFSVRVCEPRTPKHLGFECHRVLAEQHQNFDYNGYLEDDLVISDADFFLKLNHFNRCFGDHYLLQPNRIETSVDLQSLRRFYIDGDYNPPATETYRLSMEHRLCLDHLGQVVEFRQPLNTHSGCFFLNRNQSQHYFNGPHWSDGDDSFHSPLESAATLGVMKSFQIMKPVLRNGRFLTIEHAGRNFMGLLRTLPAS